MRMLSPGDATDPTAFANPLLPLLSELSLPDSPPPLLLPMSTSSKLALSPVGAEAETEVAVEAVAVDELRGDAEIAASGPLFPPVFPLLQALAEEERLGDRVAVRERKRAVEAPGESARRVAAGLLDTPLPLPLRLSPLKLLLLLLFGRLIPI